MNTARSRERGSPPALARGHANSASVPSIPNHRERFADTRPQTRSAAAATSSGASSGDASRARSRRASSSAVRDCGGVNRVVASSDAEDAAAASVAFHRRPRPPNSTWKRSAESQRALQHTGGVSLGGEHTFTYRLPSRTADVATSAKIAQRKGSAAQPPGCHNSSRAALHNRPARAPSGERNRDVSTR